MNVECEHGIEFTMDAACNIAFCGLCLKEKQPGIFLRHLSDNDIKLFPQSSYEKLKFNYDKIIRIFKRLRCTYIMCEHCGKTYQGIYLKHHMRT